MKKTTRFVLSAASLAALFCSLPGHAASVTTYADDRAAFLAATGATSIGALPGAPSGPTTADNTTIGPVTFHKVGVSTAVFFKYSNEISGNVLSTSSVENFDMSLAAGAYSIGFAVHQPNYRGINSYALPGSWGCNAACFDTTFSIELLSGGTSLGKFTYVPPVDADPNQNGGASVGFFGAHSSVAFDEVRVRDVTNTIDDEFFGDFVAGRTAIAVSTVPEPSTYAMMMIGLGTLALAKGRRKFSTDPGSPSKT